MRAADCSTVHGPDVHRMDGTAEKKIFFFAAALMEPGEGSVCIGMTPATTITTALFALFVGLGSTANAGTPSLAESIPAYSRDANGIAMAVTELLPSIDNCVAAHQALGGEPTVQFDINFAVDTTGAVDGLSIATETAHNTGVDSCIEGTLSAMRFAPGATAIPVQMPLTAAARTETAMH